jgi:3-oxoacyl-[acyl-carrier-protein] synthase II
MDGVSAYALIAAREAVQSAGLLTNDEVDADDIGFSIGSFSGPLSVRRYESRVHSVTAAVFAYYGSVIGNVTIPLKISGPSHTLLNLDVAGIDAIGYAYEIIRHGKARAMLAGGADTALNIHVFSALDRAGFLSGADHKLTAPGRGSNGNPCGAVPSEGAALLLLERLDCALARGRSIYAEVLGYSTIADGCGSEGMSLVFKQAKADPRQVDCLVANCTGYSPLDYQEVRSVQRLFGKDRCRSAVTNITWAVGHALAAAGAMQAVTSALILKEQRIPPVGNLDVMDEFSSLDVVNPPGRSGPIGLVLQSTFGFSGKKSFLLLGKYQ